LRADGHRRGIGWGEEIRAGVVISNADPEITFGQLIGKDRLSPRLKRKVESVLFDILPEPVLRHGHGPARRGLDSGNFWFYDHADVDSIYSDGLTDACCVTRLRPACS
jgi:all-trans-retinol 13,14-reductase